MVVDLSPDYLSVLLYLFEFFRRAYCLTSYYFHMGHNFLCFAPKSTIIIYILFISTGVLSHKQCPPPMATLFLVMYFHLQFRIRFLHWINGNYLTLNTKNQLPPLSVQVPCMHPHPPPPLLYLSQ